MYCKVLNSTLQIQTDVNDKNMNTEINSEEKKMKIW